MGINLYQHQKDALTNLKTGSILCGSVGTGKSRTALAYYFTQEGGELEPYVPMNDIPRDLYIITTARKRDEKEWEGELVPFLLDPNSNIYANKVVIDSWNNIKKYVGVENAFFIFDEQRVVGSGAWVKAFYKIAKVNDWILLSGTPGDVWMDYVPVFVANGFYRNKTEFINEHVVYDYRNKNFPKIDRYINTGRLIRLRNNVLVDMDFKKKTIPNNIDIIVDYDIKAYKDLFKYRWNAEKEKPIENASELCYEARKIVNSSKERVERLKDIVNDKHRVIVFYNFDYELDILKSETYTTSDGNVCDICEWNGHKHQPVPESDNWVYLVQYTAGCEAWNCIRTDTIVFYSQNYSYKVMIQASGRIDRLNTPYTNLYYYHFKTKSGIDLAISKALKSKKKFNESRFINQ